MTPSPELLASLKQIDMTRKEMRRLADQRPDGWKTDYAKLRVQFQGETSKAILLTETWLRQKGDPALQTKYREMLEHANSDLAKHQARYPAILLDGTNPDYVASMQNVNSNFDRLLAFVHSTLN